jgi:hypothetical protein
MATSLQPFVACSLIAFRRSSRRPRRGMEVRQGQLRLIAIPDEVRIGGSPGRISTTRFCCQFVSRRVRQGCKQRVRPATGVRRRSA